MSLPVEHDCQPQYTSNEYPPKKQYQILPGSICNRTCGFFGTWCLPDVKLFQIWIAWSPDHEILQKMQLEVEGICCGDW